MITKTHLLWFLGGALYAGVASAEGLGISSTGITFSDDSIQSTAAVPKNVVIVSPEGARFDNPLDALTAISTAGDAAADSPYELQIGPGVYDLGTMGLQMLEYVDIVGAGQNVTVITSSIDSATTPNATVKASNNATLRDLTIQNTSTTSGTGVLTMGSDDTFILQDVAVIADVEGTGEGTSAIGIDVQNSEARVLGGSATAMADSENVFGIRIGGNSSDPLLRGVSASAEGGTNTSGIQVDTGSLASLVEVITTASGSSGSNGGVTAEGTFTMDRSTADSTAPIVCGANATGLIAHSKLAGGDVSVTSGCDLTCTYVSDGDYDALGSDCTPPT